MEEEEKVEEDKRVFRRSTGKERRGENGGG
jgi:hypothetical protein